MGIDEGCVRRDRSHEFVDNVLVQDPGVSLFRHPAAADDRERSHRWIIADGRHLFGQTILQRINENTFAGLMDILLCVAGAAMIVSAL